MRSFLLVYVTFMVAVSTINMVTLIIAFAVGHNILAASKNLDFDPEVFPNGYAGILCGIFASWGADLFMVRLFR